MSKYKELGKQGVYDSDFRFRPLNPYYRKTVHPITVFLNNAAAPTAFFFNAQTSSEFQNFKILDYVVGAAA